MYPQRSTCVLAALKTHLPVALVCSGSTVRCTSSVALNHHSCCTRSRAQRRANNRNDKLRVTVIGDAERGGGGGEGKGRSSCKLQVVVVQLLERRHTEKTVTILIQEE
jgi:hypothetical protein